MIDDRLGSRSALAVACTVIVMVSVIPGAVALTGSASSQTAGVGSTAGVDTVADGTDTGGDDPSATGGDATGSPGALSAELRTIVANAPSDRAAALTAAEQAIAARSDGGLDDAAAGTPESAQMANLHGATEILGLTEGTPPDTLAEATRLTRAGFELQVAQARTPAGASESAAVALPGTPTPDHATPSAAAFALLERNDVTPTAEQVRDIRALDDLPEPARSALADYLDAALGYRTSTAAAYADVNWTVLHQVTSESADARAAQRALERLRSSSDGQPDRDVLRRLAAASGDDDPVLGAAGIDVARVRAAQLQLLQATVDLQAALEDTEDGGTGESDDAGGVPPAADYAPADGVRVPGVLSIDLSTHDNTYDTDYAVQIDVGGDDTYDNNAGGAAGTGAPPANQPTPEAAALVDFGGDDAYNGRNGGGDDVAVGFLVDAGLGEDTYDARSGDFDPTGHGVNGGGNVASLGFLLDTGGEDRYEGGQKGVNGGGHNVGTGFLLDTGRGEDTYRAGDNGTNGGGRGLGRGFLVDTGGEDTYVGRDRGVNGGGRDGGLGFLVDAGDGEETYRGGFGGPNGGGGFDSTGGFLLDDGGEDTYQAGAEGTNGGNLGVGIGFLIDVGPGEDTFEAGFGATNGGGVLDAGGHLLNVGPGEDTYDADWGGTNGGGFAVGVGLLLDTAGDDTYEGTHTGTNGGGAAFPIPFRNVTVPLVSASLLVDAGGDDFYNDTNVTCVDCSRIPKGTFGAQVDADDPTGSGSSGTTGEGDAEKG